jgi:hypothetical protein
MVNSTRSGSGRKYPVTPGAAAREAFARMSEEELTALILHLGRYALRESGRLCWRTGSSVELPGGETVESVVSLALEKVLSGERHWDPQSNPNIRKYLMDVIDSLLNHLVTGKENVLFTTAPEAPETSGNETTRHRRARVEGSGADWLDRQESSPEAGLLWKEEEELNERALKMLVEESKDDPVLVRVLEAMLSGEDKAGRIADATGIKVRDVYNAMKRLDRKATQVSARIKGIGS